MSYPGILRRLFANDGRGPQLRADIVPYELCRVVYNNDIHPTSIKPGFVPVNGTIITDAVTRYPAAWEYLQTAEGQELCVSEAEWQAASTAYWHTASSGTKIGWEGIGGVCKYVLDAAAGSIRVPDLRGMFAEVAGFDSLGVGGVKGAGVPNIEGNFRFHGGGFTSFSGSFLSLGAQANSPQFVSFSNQTCIVGFDASRSSPIYGASSKTVQPRAYGVSSCVYLGLPAS